ncbi:MAG: hypothetical protein A2Y14_04790 [Verrucomicrobia bacterium GWF2_51_19]|nr:MAG: hypothetical protein A2Y14_04790 [Verrucomicrobia bacterium GWF2_51_19]HCJ12276.1 manganese ABC transporter permease [Opitutae bacterium]
MYPFIIKAILGVILVGVSCAWVGSFVVLRRMTFLSEALSHTVLPGVVVAYLFGWPLLVGALGAGLVTVVGIGLIGRSRKVRSDSVIGILLSGMLALGVLLMGLSGSFRDFSGLLFGNVLSLDTLDLIFAGVVLVVLAGVFSFFNKELVLSSYDPEYAETIGIHPKRLQLLLLVATALGVITGIKLLGALLTTAMLVLPATSAFLVTKRFAQGVLLAMAYALIAGLAGIYLSYTFDVLSGPAIVLVACLLFAITWLLRR